MKDMMFDFSVGFDEEIEYVSPYGDETETECEEFLQSLLDDGEIEIGERSEGNIKIENNVVTLSYRVCTNVGEDWNDDNWEDVEQKIHLPN